MTMFKGRAHRIHFVGIGGIGMSGIAEVLLNLGYQVSGSDLRENDTTQRLSQLGGVISVGHSPENLRGADVVVISSAVRSDNPEVVAARRQTIPVIPRAEMLAELMRLKHGLAVAGSHGKTTTTSLVAAICERGGLDPTVVIGGKVNSMGTNARLGAGAYLVAEADESDGSFLQLSPTIAVVTNIDPEHLDHYGDFEQLKQAFLRFVNRVPFYGAAVLCLECPNVQAMIPHVEKRFVSYGTTAQADFTLVDVSVEGLVTRFRPVRRGKVGDPIALKMVGRHNLLNALAALAVADELKIDPVAAARALEEFDGIQRRFTVRGEQAGVMVVDDYGHHPTEIRATLAGAKESFGDRRRIAVFQPHRYSRAHNLFEDFSRAFYDADLVVVAPLYAAGEQPLEGVTAATMAEAIRSHGHHAVKLASNLDDVVNILAGEVKDGDIVITLGAGNIADAGVRLLDRLATR
ncbi:MAG: UDP-N-acetylmuramate--L-alanine ligase [Deltaproteobacteria bacterium]|nr:UDP-N-acetylmuramate--L-alanine ligase [Deltaproteobacteria bacterium]